MKIIKKKSLGQNFLKDDEVLDKIILAGELSDSDNILEIGPGEGALTKKLLEKGGKVVAIEKDERLKDKNSSLQKICHKSDLLQNKIRLYFGDILEVNLPEILRENSFEDNGYKVIANIPYYITGKILRLLFQQRPLPKVVVLLVQKEVADRIGTKKGRQSILSLSVQYYADVEIVAYVPRESFDPAPKVDSAILKIIPFQNIEYDKKNEESFFKLVKVGFSSPRKVLINNLKSGLKIDREKLEIIFKNININQDIRAEKLTIDNWKALGREGYYKNSF
jgi:16S rRNA (adenine1518-N6/adenine1519-N6)-dimethyltransferase